MTLSRRTFQRAALAAAAASPSFAAPYQPTPGNLERRRWFQDAKFGLFVHWGVYSVLGKGEWVMHNDKMTSAAYETLPPQFNPSQFNAAEWVSLAKAAGMKYITITSKHHDGFAMFGTKLNRWNIVDSTPYGRDPLKMLADECRNQDVKLFFYHSHLDWHHPDYFPRGRTGMHSGRPESGDFNKYLDFMDAQLSELLTGYGDVAGIWFDGVWDRRDANWRLRQTYDLIHKLQPSALVGNNHHLKPNDGEDFQMFEKDLPGQNQGGHSAESEIGNLPLETCDTINGAWGYNASDKRFKSAKALVQYLVRAAGNNANFLLNVGPKPDGTLQPEFVDRLKAIGEWTAKYGETIYGTRGGPVPPRQWGVSTRKGSKIYLHILDWQDAALVVPAWDAAVRNVKLFGSRTELKFTRINGAHVISLPKLDPASFDTILEIETA